MIINFKNLDFKKSMTQFMKFVDRFIVMDKGRIIYDGFPLDK